ncbi:MAG: hypothetical protein IT223_03280 [Crocinitomicaceae bacterium]|nr:hypothetical protein [Crocinitomicaceae bacterium]
MKTKLTFSHCKITAILLTMFATAFATQLACAQSHTLEFSQATLVTSLQTVPSGKVWKVLSVASNSDQLLTMPGNCATKGNSTQIKVNGTTIHISARYATNSSSCYSNYSAGSSITSTGDLTQLPFWIPENTTLDIGTGAAFISVLEFTVQ